MQHMKKMMFPLFSSFKDDITVALASKALF